MFANRRAAGRQLADRLQHLRPDHPLVLALPRGGVPVGFEIATSLGAQLDLVLVRKVGVPWQPELALGAVVDEADPQVLINEDLAAELGIDESYIAAPGNLFRQQAASVGRRQDRDHRGRRSCDRQHHARGSSCG
jgi:putative phosphoribosyl transferase